MTYEMDVAGSLAALDNLGRRGQVVKYVDGVEGRVGPLDAIEQLLSTDPRWELDQETDGLSPLTTSPKGWWVKQ